jgi:glycosyltransferase involved in cell wall biosynthesis
MNIVIIGHTYISPINRKKWVVFAQLYPSFNITVIFPKSWPTTLFNHKAEICDEYYLPNCRFVALDVRKAGNELLYSYKAYQLYKVMREAKPSIIQVEQGCSAISYAQANIIARMINRKIISLFFTWINWEQKESFKHRVLLHPIEQLNLASAHGAIVGNHDAGKILQKKKFIKPIYVIPQLGVDTDIFKPNPTPQSGRRRIGFIGRFTLEKGILTLLEAFTDLAYTFPLWDLVFIGKGPARETLEQAINHHNLQERSFIIDPVPHEQIASLINNLDILVLPSYDTPTWREQFGHVIIEAMACGVAVIGSNAGEIPHVIDIFGLVFEQKNAQALLAQLKTLMQDDGLRQALADQGLNHARTKYSHQAIAEQTHACWMDVLEQKNGTGNPKKES